MSVHTDFKYLNLISYQLRNYKQTESCKANFSCPICGDSKKVSWKARGYVYVFQNKTFFKCQNCGEAKSFSSFLRHINESVWQDWRKESVHDEPTFNFPLEPKSVAVKKQQYDNMVEILSLDESHPCRVYVSSRMIPRSRQTLLFYTQNFHDLVAEIFPGKELRYPQDERLVIPIFNQNGELIAVSGRSLSGSRIRYSTAKLEHERCFFGMERVNLRKPVIVTEGPIDSLFLPNSVAVCNAELGMFGKEFPAVNSFLVFDNEPRNPQILKNMQKALEDERRICVWHNCPFEGKDINDMVKNGADIREIVKFILYNSHKGQSARLKILEWRRAS